MPRAVRPSKVNTRRPKREVDLKSSPGQTAKTSRLTVIQNTATRSARSTDKEEPQFRIAVDFGTTFTTVAFHDSRWEEMRVETIDTFPGAQNLYRSGLQQPTRLLYPNSVGPAVYSGHNAVHFLGQPAYPDTGLVVKPKLLLDTGAHVTKARSRLLGVLDHLKTEGHIQEHEDVLTEYLTYLFSHTKTDLMSRYRLREDDTGICSLHRTLQPRG
jgi:hypothetical protein